MELIGTFLERLKSYSLDKRVKKIQSSIPFEEAIWLEELCKITGEKEATVIAFIIKDSWKRYKDSKENTYQQCALTS